MTILEGHLEGGFEVEIGLKYQQLCGESGQVPVSRRWPLCPQTV
jgi:hypothetical protein